MTKSRNIRHQFHIYRYECDGHKILLSRALAAATGQYTQHPSRQQDALWRSLCDHISAALPAADEWEIHVHHQYSSGTYVVGNVSAHFYD